jgi:protein N-terminal methyltransferase
MKRKVVDRAGCDMEGNAYPSSREMWAAELQTEGQHDSIEDTVEDDLLQVSSGQWYSKSSSYWKKQDPSVKGMLGGMDNLHDPDIRGSRAFLNKLVLRHGLRTGVSAVAIDVGAGIGRITNALLLPMFGTVDMLEQNEEYLVESKQHLKPSPEHPHLGVVQYRIARGMQEFTSEDSATGTSYRDRYDLIWIQWCIIYLTDEDLVSFLKECFKCLATGGIICVKDNTTPRGPHGFVLDKEDSSVMRSNLYMKDLFEQAGACCIAEHAHRDFPSHTFPVRTWALIEQAKATNAGSSRPTENTRITRQTAKFADAK